MTEFDSINDRLDELAQLQGYRHFSEEADVVDEMIEEADAAGDLLQAEHSQLRAKYKSILAQSNQRRAA